MPVFTGDQLEIRIDPELSECEGLHILVTHDDVEEVFMSANF